MNAKQNFHNDVADETAAGTSSYTILMRLKNYDEYIEDGLCVITLTDDFLRRLHDYSALVNSLCEEHGASHIQFNFAGGVDHLENQPESLEDYDLWNEEWLLTNEPYDIRNNPAHETESAQLTYAMRGSALRVFRDGDMVFRCYHKWSGLEYETDVISLATLDAWATILAGVTRPTMGDQ
jgi:hypothetical protein